MISGRLGHLSLIHISSVSRIPVVTELAPDARYDVIFVVLRYTQLDSVLDTLRANRTKNIVFVGNNVQARALHFFTDGSQTDNSQCPTDT